MQKKDILTSRNRIFFKFEHFHKYDITIVHMKLWDCGFSIKTISYLIFIYHFQGYSFNVPHDDITLESFRWTILRKNDVIAQCQSSVNAQ